MNTVYRKKGKTVTRRLTFKKADVAFLTSPPKRRRDCKKFCRKALNNRLSLIKKGQ